MFFKLKVAHPRSVKHTTLHNVIVVKHFYTKGADVCVYAVVCVFSIDSSGAGCCEGERMALGLHHDHSPSLVSSSISFYVVSIVRLLTLTGIDSWNLN